MPRKSIFRQPSAQHFQLVHRSQRAPLIHDPDASQHVSKPLEQNDKKRYILTRVGVVDDQTVSKPLERNNKKGGPKSKASNQRVGDGRPRSTVMQPPFELLNSTEGGARMPLPTFNAPQRNKENTETTRKENPARTSRTSPNTPTNLRHSRPGCTRTCPIERSSQTRWNPGPSPRPAAAPQSPARRGLPLPSHCRSTAGQTGHRDGPHIAWEALDLPR
ncbi:hypothetical protein DFH06DRAFT_310031 [Mycena polygramma]|nr:hypothetical protein DFH06DRAFT_310031 [Mycena polygramma]